jgi:hypothetical protein
MKNNTNAKIMGGVVLLGFIVGGYFLFKTGSDKSVNGVDSEKAFKVFDGKEYTLYKSGSKKEVKDYMKKYGIPEKAQKKVVKEGKETRLYLHFSK